MKITEIRSDGPGRKPVSTEDIRRVFDSLHQDMSNATIDVAPYNSASFRVDRVEDMIRKLTSLRNRLATDDAIEKAKFRK